MDREETEDDETLVVSVTVALPPGSVSGTIATIVDNHKMFPDIVKRPELVNNDFGESQT